MKKGQMSIETIIIVILALLVLVIIAASFSGGMAALWKKIIGISESTTTTDLASAKSKCEALCSAPKAFCGSSYLVDGVPRGCPELSVVCTPAVDCTKV